MSVVYVAGGRVNGCATDEEEQVQSRNGMAGEVEGDGVQ